MPITDKTNEQIVSGLALEGDQSKKLLKLLHRSGLNVSDFDSIDGFFDAVRAEGANGTLGTGGKNSKNRVNSLIRLMNTGGVNSPGGAGGAPIFENPQLSSIKIAMGNPNPEMGDKVDQAQQIQQFMAQQRGTFLGQLPGQPQLAMPGVTGATAMQPPNVSRQGLLSRGTPEGAALLKKLKKQG